VPDWNFSSRLLVRLASLEVALGILIFICLAAIPGTFLANRHAYYGNILFIALLGALATSLFCCTIRRLKTIARSVLLLHTGILIVLGGFLVREFSGTVATVNLYEGEAIDSFYLPYRDVEVALGFSLLVTQINADYYPVQVKVGVLKAGEKHSLHTVKTGDQFTVDGYQVLAEKFSMHDQLLTLTILDQKRRIGRADTQGNVDLPANFPLSFKLVAYQTPRVARSWLAVQVKRQNKPLVIGTTEINHPLVVDGYHIYYVQNAKDDQGRTFVGVQIVKDPGRPLVFFGMAIVVLGALMASYRRLHEVQ